MNELELTTADLQLLGARGISAENALQQLRILKQRPTPSPVVRPCTMGDGIRSIDSDEHEALLEAWQTAATSGRISKFVPASGAATRMFAELPLDPPEPGVESEAVLAFLDRRHEFAFADELEAETAAQDDGDARVVIRALLEPHRLGYGALPKALIPFHSYPDGARTAFVEQLVEGAAYVASRRGGTTRIHFTVTPDHRELFERLLATVRESLQEALQVRLAVDFSTQDPATDTLSVDSHGAPFRDSEGDLVLRPAGHGALLNNLERSGGDIVVVKNIDNILPEDRQPEVVLWKRLLIGLLLRLEEALRDVGRQLESPSCDLGEAAHTTGRILGLETPAGQVGDWVADRLRRPLRVCGMVRNSGEPGGGPFWVSDHRGGVSPQIVEGSQIDRSDPRQAAAWRAATHFNPVDLVCSLRDCRGQPYELGNFVDPDTAFVSCKDHNGRSIWALERPGLWNGAMAGWNSVFVEVPATTFAPVKTVLDLLRPEHLPSAAGD